MNSQRTGRTIRNIAIIAILIALIGVGSSFAALSQNINIGGTAIVRGGTWDIRFANLEQPIIVGAASIDTPATLTLGTTMHFAVSLNELNDSVTYEFDMVNNGSIDVRINAVKLTGVTEAMANSITYTLTYANGNPIAVNDELSAGEAKPLRLTISLDQLPNTSTRNIPLNLGATIVLVQN